MVAGARLLDPDLHRLIADAHQPRRLVVDRPDGVGAARVAVPAVKDGADVHGNDVTFPEDPLAGDAVDDLVVDRGADAAGEPVVALERRPRPASAQVPVNEAVKVAGADTRLDLLLQRVEDLGHQPPSLAHLRDLVPVLEHDLAAGH